MKRLKLALMLMIALIMLFVTGCDSTSPQESNALSTGDTNTTADQPDASGTEGNEQPDSNVPNAEQSISVFDSRLAGYWYQYENSNDGDIKGVFDVIGATVSFLYDGTFYNDLDLPFDETYVIGGLEPLIINAENGQMDFGAKWLSYLVQNEAIEQAETDRYCDISITYEIFDITSEEAEQASTTGSAAKNLSNYSDDGLRVHISGSYQKNSLTKQSIDFTNCYYKNYHNRNFMESYLVGSWEDDTGNKWDFTYQEGENSWPDFVYSMADTNGAEHLSKQGYFLEYGSGVEALHEPNELGYIMFQFESFFSPWYKIESMQADTMSLVSDEGNIVLTRR